jgi:hypothetical protein
MEHESELVRCAIGSSAGSARAAPLASVQASIGQLQAAQKTAGEKTPENKEAKQCAAPGSLISRPAPSNALPPEYGFCAARPQFSVAASPAG